MALLQATVKQQDGQWCVFSEDGTTSLAEVERAKHMAAEAAPAPAPVAPPVPVTASERNDELIRLGRLRSAIGRGRTPPTLRVLRAAAGPMRISGEPLDPEGFQWPIVIQEAGPWRTSAANGHRFYTLPEALQAAVGTFEGTKSYRNHQTEREAAERPERDQGDVIGVVTGVRWDPNVGKLGALVGVWNVVDNETRARVLNAHKLGVLDRYGSFSITAAGSTETRQIDGQTYEVVTSFTDQVPASVDHVTEPAAGGRFARLAASLRAGGQVMSLAALQQSEPALVKALMALSADEQRALLAKMGLDDAELLAELAKAAAPAAPPAPAPVVAAVPAPVVAPVLAAQEPKPDIEALTAAAVKRALESHPVLKAVQEQQAEAAITALVASLPAGEHRDFAATTLRAAVGWGGEAQKSFVESYRKTLANQADAQFAGFPTTLTAAGVQSGAAQFDKWNAGMDGFFQRRDVTIGEGKDAIKVPRFSSIRQALANFPRFKASNTGGWRTGIVGYNDMQRAWHELKSYYKADGVDAWIQRNGEIVPFKASITTTTFGEATADRMHKDTMRRFQAPDELDVFLSLASKVKDVGDFRTHREIIFGGYGDAVTVAEGATYPVGGTPTDAEETYSLSKYGRIEDITWEAWLDEDNDWFSQIPEKLASSIRRAARKLIIDRVTTANPTLNQDSVALYHSTHANTGTSALTVASANGVRIAMRKQTERDNSERLGELCEPAAVLFPEDLNDIAETVFSPSPAIMASVAVLGTDAALDPQAAWRKKCKRISVPHWTDVNNHYYIADPNKIDTFAVAFLNGIRDVELFTQDAENSPSMFNADKRSFKGRFCIGITPLTYQAFYSQIVT